MSGTFVSDVGGVVHERLTWVGDDAAAALSRHTEAVAACHSGRDDVGVAVTPMPFPAHGDDLTAFHVLSHRPDRPAIPGVHVTVRIGPHLLSVLVITDTESVAALAEQVVAAAVAKESRAS